MDLLTDHIHIDLAKIVNDYAAEWALLEWIDMGKFNWCWLSGNPNDKALELLAQHPEKIDWCWLSGNPSIFYLKSLF